MAKNRESKVTRARQTIIGFLGLIAMGFLGLSLYYGTDLSRIGPALEGEDYTLLDDPIRARTRDAREIIEYFSYRCIHCKNFESILEDWLTEIPKNTSFERQHVVFSSSDELYARTHIVLQDDPNYLELHQRFFSAIHDRQKRFNDLDDLTAYFEDSDIDTARFTRDFNSPSVSRQLQNNRNRQAQSQLSATPSLLVSGKYIISMSNGQQRALEIASELIDRENNSEPKS